jgi:hypothetical protein
MCWLRWQVWHFLNFRENKSMSVVAIKLTQCHFPTDWGQWATRIFRIEKDRKEIPDLPEKAHFGMTPTLTSVDKLISTERGRQERREIPRNSSIRRRFPTAKKGSFRNAYASKFSDVISDRGGNEWREISRIIKCSLTLLKYLLLLISSKECYSFSFHCWKEIDSRRFTNTTNRDAWAK